jgi:hypothetical protein
LEAKAWYERLIVQQQDPRPLKSTDAEYVELMWKLRAEQQRTAAQAGAAKENENGQNQKIEKIHLLLNRISCPELWTVRKEFGQVRVEENVGM